ncbi:hypothetical protein BGX28_003433 [Mortierella sp. GBA30]|nr:hypothetical protein BGX28_003433 [Mortierella sp. GBA30]
MLQSSYLFSLAYRTDNIKQGNKIGHGAQAEVFKAKCGLDDVVQDMLVMEYVEGGILADAITDNRLKTWEVKTQIAKDAALGLAYLHMMGIIHCDIKSANILLSMHKEAKIYDFGLARTVGERSGGGTLQWMAPELLQDLPQSPEERPAAVDMLLDVRCSSCGEGANELTNVGNKVEKAYYLKALKQYTGKSRAYMALLKVGEMHIHDASKGMEKWILEKYDGSIMEWFSTGASGNEFAAAIFNIGGIYYYGRGAEKDYLKALDWYLAAYEAGVTAAMLKTSEIYQYGRGVEQDDNEAASWYLKAVKSVEEQGNLNNRLVHHDTTISEHHRRTMEWFSNDVRDLSATCKLNIGYLYDDGRELERDYNRAIEWYLRAIEAGASIASLRIGYLYQKGLGVEQDYVKAVEWYLKARDDGRAEAMVAIDALYDDCRGVDQSYGKALWSASDAGVAEAMLAIGLLYDYGRGVDQDCDIALEWYLKASDGGYKCGLGVDQNYVNAREWYLKARDTGVASALFTIGALYDDGHGIDQDYGEARKWYLKASDAGVAGAMFAIGAMYNIGLGVDQDCAKALELFLKASHAGRADAMFTIGNFYVNGHGVDQDYGNALEYYFKASDAGLAIATFAIGNFYLNGSGVDQDHVMALEWYLKAGNAGDVDAMFMI